MFDWLGMTVLFVLLVVCCWLVFRATRFEATWLKWSTAILAGIATIVFAVLIGVAGLGFSMLNKTHDNPVASVDVAVTPERVARGKRFELICASCHSTQGSAELTGLNYVTEDDPPVGQFYAPNLTPTQLADWSDGELIRAIREGIHRSGRSLLFKPAEFMHNLSDEDTWSIVAFLRSLKPTGQPTPPNRLNTLGAILAVQSSLFSAQPPVRGVITAPPPEASAAYGAYVASFTCEMCHGVDLMGNIGPPLQLVPSVWNEQQFIRFIREGRRPNDSQVDGDDMPWPVLSHLLSDDDEIRAVYAHLRQRFGVN